MKGRKPTEPIILEKREWNPATIVLFSLMVLLAVVAVPVFGFMHGYIWLDWTMFGVLYVVRALGITVGYHRLFTHRSFECKDWIRITLLIAGGWALENTARKWCSDHARHHARADQEDDPYNAKRGFWYSHIGWVLQRTTYYSEEYTFGLLEDWTVMWQERWYVPIVLSGFALPFLVGYIHGGWIRGLGCFLLAGFGCVFLVLNSTFCINSVCHLWGAQPYTTSNSSRDCWWVSLITMGEGYHNYHHAFPRDYRNGPLRRNFDPSKWFVFGLSLVGLAWNLKRIPDWKREAARHAVLNGG
ncbi:MAG: acyl-CoA desaturase [Patescibacteria group bacterium]|nr:acyl-CoA desaturase [Patescibacteria group bacterium]